MWAHLTVSKKSPFFTCQLLNTENILSIESLTILLSQDLSFEIYHSYLFTESVQVSLFNLPKDSVKRDLQYCDLAILFFSCRIRLHFLSFKRNFFIVEKSHWLQFICKYEEVSHMCLNFLLCLIMCCICVFRAKMRSGWKIYCQHLHPNHRVKWRLSCHVM